MILSIENPKAIGEADDLRRRLVRWQAQANPQGVVPDRDGSGLVHSVVGTAANVADVTQVDKLHGDENVACADAGDLAEKRPEHEGREVTWQVVARRSTYKNSISAECCTKPGARLKRPRLGGGWIAESKIPGKRFVWSGIK